MLDPARPISGCVSFESDRRAGVRSAGASTSTLRCATRSRSVSDSALGEEQPRAERYQHPLLQKPDSARRECQRELRHASAVGGSQLSAVTISRTIRGHRERAVNRIIVRIAASVRCSATCSAAPTRSGRVGVQIGYPIGPPASGARKPRAGAATASAVADAAEEPCETQVATQVRLCRAQRSDQPAARPVGARVAQLQEQKLEAEEKKLAAGMSSELLRVPGAARPISVARIAELQAISDYNKSLVDFDGGATDAAERRHQQSVS